MPFSIMFGWLPPVARILLLGAVTVYILLAIINFIKL